MLILALDTTTRAGSVAVVRDDTVLALVPGDAGRTHGERLPGELAMALDLAGVRRADLDLLTVASGPGAFTGLRIGLAAMQGLAMALGRPVVGVSALDALAYLARLEPVEWVAPWMDAQRGEVSASLHRRVPHALVEAPVTGSPEALLEAWRPRLDGQTALFLGDAAVRDAALIARVGAGQWTARAPEPLAPAIAHLGREMAAAGHTGSPHALEPVYVRRPDVEVAKARRHTHD